MHRAFVGMVAVALLLVGCSVLPPATSGWQKVGNVLVGGPMATPLDSGFELHDADAAIDVELTLADASTTAASLMIGGSHIGFCGRNGEPFLEGGLFGGGVRTLSAPRVVAGEVFCLRVVRGGGELRIDWNGTMLPPIADPGGDLGAVRLRPHRDTMRVRRFVVRGGTRPPKPIGESAIVWQSGEDGVHTYRIPSLIVAADDALLAFCEARHNGGSDTGDIDIVMKRSIDGGRSWSESRTIWNDGANTCGNPCPVVIGDGGDIALLLTHNLGVDHESRIIAQTSKGTRTVWVMRSGDHGKTWSDPEQITATTKQDDWTWYATGPGAGIQLQRGVHRGRLVIPCDHIEAGTKRYFSHVIFSDDRGATWQLGGRTPVDKVNECEVAERNDGSLLLNMRNYDRSQRTRQQAISRDGGMTFTEQRHVPELIEPICQASLRRRGDVLLFSNPASSRGRERMTLRASFDDGETWPWSALLDPGRRRIRVCSRWRMVR